MVARTVWSGRIQRVPSCAAQATGDDSNAGRSSQHGLKLEQKRAQAKRQDEARSRRSWAIINTKNATTGVTTSERTRQPTNPLCLYRPSQPTKTEIST